MVLSADHRLFRRLGLKTLLLVLLFTTLHTNHARAESTDSIVAVFLYNFANFIEWPVNAFQRNANLEVCLLGNVGFVDTMRSFEGTSVRGHPMRVVATNDEQMVRGGCHILYVGLDRRAELQQFMRNLNHMFVLSVGENSSFLEDGGTINIFRTADQAEFSIDLSRAMRSGLTVSSDLLELATVINEN